MNWKRREKRKLKETIRFFSAAKPNQTVLIGCCSITNRPISFSSLILRTTDLRAGSTFERSLRGIPSIARAHTNTCNGQAHYAHVHITNFPNDRSIDRSWQMKFTPAPCANSTHQINPLEFHVRVQFENHFGSLLISNCSISNKNCIFVSIKMENNKTVLIFR